MILNNRYDITVIVATYNCNRKKLIKTVATVIKQKNVNMQLIIADDGSIDKDFSFIDDYFEENKFENYKLLISEENKGTCKNMYNALRAAEGTYIKPISPGDYLYDENTLSKLLLYVKENDINVCFGDAVYYKNIDNKIMPYQHIKSSPAFKRLYAKKGKFKYLQKITFIVLRQRILGAACFIEREHALRYCLPLLDKIIYQEDSMFAFMLLDNIDILYYPENVIFYEFGEGVSTTSNSKWKRVMREELMVLENIIASKDANDLFSKRVKRLFSYKNNNKIKKHLNRLLIMPESEVLWVISQILVSLGFSKTTMKYNLKYLQEIENDKAKIEEIS